MVRRLLKLLWERRHCDNGYTRTGFRAHVEVEWAGLGMGGEAEMKSKVISAKF